MGSVSSHMNIAPAGEPAAQKTLRLWPGVVAVVLQWLMIIVVPIVAPDAIIYCIVGGLLAGLAVLVWWAFFSRAPGLERWGAIILMIVASVAASRIIDRSIATGLMGFMFPFFSIPTLSLALVAGAVFSRVFAKRLSTGSRRAAMAAAIVLACGGWTLLRTNGITGGAAVDFAWRWSKTHEQRLVAQSGSQASALPGALPEALPVATVAARISVEPIAAHKAEALPLVYPPAPIAPKTEAEWPGFRGPGRDSIIPGTHIETDWSTSPPVELWRRPIGPGWGSFAVQGDLLYTQEQRGEEEIVTCYNATTGNPVWAHRDAARFWESNGGAGPACDADPLRGSRVRIWRNRHFERARRR